MNFWLEIAAFALKALIIVVALGGAVFLIMRAARGERGDDSEIQVKSLNDRFGADEARLRFALLDKRGRKAFAKARKAAKKAPPPEKRVFALRFKGDVGASAVGRLGREIDAVLSVARPGVDEVVVRIDSPGGTVTGYGLAGAQLRRLRAQKIALTACVDQVAASGGYLMACVADRIVAAPFALVGSIGVVAQLPNLNRLLRKNEIDYEEITAGEFKRSVSIFGEITPAGREHFKDKIGATHEAFKAFVKESRPHVDVEKVGDGDVWLARDALGLGLVDELGVADDYLFRQRDSARLYEVSIEAHKSLLQQVLDIFGFAARLVASRLLALRAGIM